ncbi:DinB family protein [Heyndrickxia oleronia]|uniref:DinB family protein n=1 Tax=Heyndrickxia oleronia TaxID=38875 RepID=UPI001C0EF3A0|nr:DinB family protein [Heyndrickxia oleronia]MBU5212282.1 DinB family protein [Heyndrickxia oleronia]
MSTSQIRDLLFSELYVAVRTTKELLKKVTEEDFSFQPNDKMRSLLEQANHLVQIPFIDLAIGQEKSEEEIRELEKKLYSNDVYELGTVMETGFNELKNYYESMSEEEFVGKVTKPFYFTPDMEGHTQAKWLIEITTHAFHHRGQLFNYLKELNKEVNMFDLY